MERNLFGGEEEIKDRWKEYFEKLLNMKGVGNEGGEEEPKRYVNVEPEIKSSSLQEVKEAIKYMRNNNAQGEDAITAEMIKYGVGKLLLRLYQLIIKIWEQEELLENWKMVHYIPIHKKGDKTLCQNCRGIALLMVVYKIFAKILAGRMTLYMEEVVGDYQCGFRKNRSTTDQIFAVRQILEKCYEHNVDIHMLSVDFKQAYDSVYKMKLIEILYSFGILGKLVRLIEISLTHTRGKLVI
jgi:hypothetical protein